MKHKSIKIPTEDTLRGTGFNTMGWTEGGKAVKNIKRLMSTFDDTPIVSSTKINRINVKCDECGKTFKTNNGKVPKHKSGYFYWNGRNIDGTVDAPKYCDGEAAVSETLDNVLHKDVLYSIGDHILYTLQERVNTKLKMVTYEDTIQSIKFENGKRQNTYFSRRLPSPEFIIIFQNNKKIKLSSIIDILKV